MDIVATLLGLWMSMPISYPVRLRADLSQLNQTVPLTYLIAAAIIINNNPPKGLTYDKLSLSIYRKFRARFSLRDKIINYISETIEGRLCSLTAYKFIFI